jgi:drug/metabolite transporter (DMT)-like permease
MTSSTSYTNDGSGNHTTCGQDKIINHPNACTESQSLLGSTSEDPPQLAENEENDLGAQGLLGTIVEGVGFFAEQAQEVATDWKEAALDLKDAIVEEATDVKDTLVNDLLDKDDGESFIFEMGLARNLSILPSDIEEVAKADVPAEKDFQTILPEVADNFYCCPEKIQDCCRPNQGNIMDSPTQPVKQVKDVESGEMMPLVRKTPPVAVSTGTPLHAYVTLLGAVICLSSIGPSLDLQKGVVDGSMKIYWRMTGTYMTLFPFALKSVWTKGLPTLSSTQWCTFLLAAFCYAMTCVCFVLALEFTSVGNAVMFANSQSILLLLGKALVGDPIGLMESSGAFTAFGGAILCACDSSASTGNAFSTVMDGPVIWAGWGDLLALLSAIGGVGYLVFAKTLREHVPSVFAFMFMIMFGGSFCVLAFLYVMGKDFTFDRDIHHGLWGFMNLQSDRLPLEIWMVLICNIGGALGYVRAMAYFDNLIISVATLMEPVVASLMAYGLKVGLLPNAMGWLGNFLVVAGTVAVIYPASHGKQASGGH